MTLTMVDGPQRWTGSFTPSDTMPKTEPTQIPAHWWNLGPDNRQKQDPFCRTHCLIYAMENHSTQTSCTNDLQSTKTTWKDTFCVPLFIFIFPMRGISCPSSSGVVVRYSCSFVPVFFLSTLCCSFPGEWNLIIIINVYKKNSDENKPLKTKKKVLHSSGAFVGMFMSSCLKLQMPSNMHGTSENTRKTGYETFWSATWPFLSKPKMIA